MLKAPSSDCARWRGTPGGRYSPVDDGHDVDQPQGAPEEEEEDGEPVEGVEHGSHDTTEGGTTSVTETGTGRLAWGADLGSTATTGTTDITAGSLLGRGQTAAARLLSAR